jgi:PAS domain S-box-containing protein
MRRQIRLVHKLVVLVIVTVSVTVVLPSILVIRSGTRTVERQVAELTLSEARRGSLLVELSLSGDLRQVLALADELGDMAGQPALREAAVRAWFARNPEALEVGALAEEAGASWRSLRGGETTAEPFPLISPPEEYSEYGLVSVAIEHHQDTPDNMLIIARPSRKLRAQLVSRWTFARYSKMLRQVQVGASGYVCLLDKHGVLLAHPRYDPGGPGAEADLSGAASAKADPGYVGAKPGSAGAKPGAPGPPTWAAPGRNLSHLALVKDIYRGQSAERLRYVNEAGHQVVGAGVIIPQLGWAIVAQEPQDEAMAPVTQMKRQILLVGATAGLVAVLLGLAIVGTIARPLEELAEAANRVGGGDLTTPVGVATRDEVGQLALAFNEMQVRLREMYDKLERMVAARTHDLQETTDFLNSVLDSSTEYGIIATDLEGTVLSYNEGARRVYGYEPEEIIGAPVSILIPAEEAEQAKWRELLAQVRREGTYSGEATRVRKGGRRFPARIVQSLRYDDVGSPIGYTAISRDITAQKQMEEQLRQYTENLESRVASKTHELQRANLELERANRLKAEFLANMSHELRTPLNAIIGFAEALRDELAGPLNQEQKQFVTDVLDSGRQLLNLISDILDLSKVDAGRMTLMPEDVVLTAIFDEVQTIVEGMAVRKGLSLAFREEPAGIILQADRTKLLQILYNLLSNAVKFTPDGGAVRVAAVQREADTLFRVSDTGIGIPPEALEMIFEEFRQVDSRLTRQYGGTGLGLSLTKKLVTLHGGAISVESQVGRGSTFTFTIPRVLPLGTEEQGVFGSPTQ